MHEQLNEKVEWLCQRVSAMNSDVDEEQWIERLRNREPGAWDEFVQQFHNLVRGVIRHTAARRRMKLQESDVEDLAADVFAAALSSLERFRHQSRLSTWLTAITRRVVHRELGRPWRVRVVRDDMAHEQPADHRTRQPLEDLVNHEKRDRLEAAIERLPVAWRNVFKLHYMQQLSYREISRRLGISVNSVGPALARARQRLRELLIREADSGELRWLNS